MSGGAEDHGPHGAAEGADDWVDDLGRRAGAAIRQPAPAAGLSALQRRHARRQLTTKLSGAGAAIALIVGGLLYANRGDTAQEPVAPKPAPETTVPTDPTWSIPAVPQTSAAPTTILAATPPQLVFSGLPVEGASAGAPNPKPFGAGVIFLPDNRSLLITRPNGGTEVLLDGDSGTVLHKFAGPLGIASKRFSPDGTRYFDGFQLWDVTTQTSVTQLVAYSNAFSSDSKWFAAYAQNSIELRDGHSGVLVWSSSAREWGLGAFSAMRFSDDGAQLQVGTRRFDVVTGAELVEAAQVVPIRPTTGFWGPEAARTPGCVPDRATFAGYPPLGIGCAISDDGTRLAIVNSRGDTVQVWITEAATG